MNTKIGTSFGLAMLMVIGVIATMFAIGMFTAKPASAAIGTVGVTVSPTTARATGQYTVTVSGNSLQNAIPVGGNITVTFGSKFSVPSSIASSAINLKSSVLSNGGTANQLISAGAVTISGRAVTITVPDMDTPSTSNGDQGIGAASLVTITFTQSAGITNPNQAQAANATGTGGITVKSSADTTAVAASTLSAITSTVSFSPSTAARGATVTVTGKGFTANCADCKIRMNSQNAVTPTTGNEGSGSIDANGVFTGTIVTDSSTNHTGWYIWVVDATGTGKAATATWTQKAGATPTATSVTPGSTVTSTLVDFTASYAFAASATTNVDVGSNTTVANTSTANTLTSSGNTAVLTPFKFVMPIGTPTGTQKVTITDGTKSASFNIDVVARTLTVSPNPAAIGQSITISGTGFTKNGTISTIAGSGGANLKGGSITIDSSGAWSHTTTMDTLEASASRTSDSYTVTATDSGSLVGTSSGFKRSARTLTLSTGTAAPGVSLEVSVTGMTVNDAENTTTATFTMSISSGTLAGTTTFPVGSDGSGTGTIAIPLAATVGTLTLTATDNAANLNADATVNRTAAATIKVAAGTLTVDPASASTGKIVTVTGSNFPPNTTGSVLTFGGASGIPSGGFSADGSGAFSFTTEVPASSTGGSLTPGNKIVVATVGSITGTTTAFAVPNPSIVITPGEAAPEDIIVIEGTGFNALSAATTLTVGTASALPSPSPKAGRSGDITANVEVPLLNPGTYTVVMTNATGFTATGTFKAVAAKAPAAANTDNTEVVFDAVISNGDNLVRVWRFSNADQSWNFYDPRPAFAAANTLAKTGAGDIVWVNVTAEQAFQGGTLFPGWNLISLN